MTGYSPRRRGSILSDMADIAQDLWASVPETVPAEKPTAVRDEPTAPQAPQTAQNPAKSADSAPKATYADEKSLPFTELWKVADEPIDWTEVVSSQYRLTVWFRRKSGHSTANMPIKCSPATRRHTLAC